MPRITLRLTTESLTEAISAVKDYRKEAMEAMNKLCAEFVSEGKQLVYKNISELQFTRKVQAILLLALRGSSMKLPE